jgi:hypothetical protein
MGTGFHGGFGNTEGAKNYIPVTKLSDVVYDSTKIKDYLLNENHPVGGSKARFMREVLGYSVDDAELFFKNVVTAIKGKVPASSNMTPYGQKYTYHTYLVGKDGAKVKANIVVVIQKDNQKTTYRIITVYPDKKVSK